MSKDPWTCCGSLMYTVTTERDEENTPVHVRRCDTCGASIETEERILRKGSFMLRADSKRRRERRYRMTKTKACKVDGERYPLGMYRLHVGTLEHREALARRRHDSGYAERQRLAKRLYRARQRTTLHLAAVGAPPTSLPMPKADLIGRKTG